MNEELALRDRHDRERLDTILKQAARIDVLEAALREIRDQYLSPNQSSAIAKAALECISYIPVEPGVNVV